MLTGSKAIKERKILDYLSNIDPKEDFSITQIKYDIHKMLGFKPAVEVEYLPEKVLLEGRMSTKEVPVSLDIIWADDIEDGDDLMVTKFYF